MFSIAVTQDGASSTQTNDAIMSATTSTSNGGEQQQLNVLDFGDIEKSLAAKLTEDHITTILNCISASNNLKTLKLAGCVNITGSCLEVIRSSAVLELLDLSLVRMHESPELDTEPLLSESVVIPILDHIMERRSLKLLHLPKTLRTNPSRGMEEFLDRYNDYLETFRYRCSKCEGLCSSTGAERWMFRDVGMEQGAQNYTCSGCLKHFCFDEDCTDEDGNMFVEWCTKCENHYCKECVPSDMCGGPCYNSYCNKCDALEKVCDGGNCETKLCKACTARYSCRYCNQTRCRDCIRTYSCYRDDCNKVICGDCIESKGEGGECNKCHFEFCSSECRYLKCSKDWERACIACTRESAISFRCKYQEGQKENEELSQGMEDLYKKYMNVDKED